MSEDSAAVPEVPPTPEQQKETEPNKNEKKDKIIFLTEEEAAEPSKRTMNTSNIPDHCWYLERVGVVEMPNFILQNSKKRIFLGRAPECDKVLKSKQASRKHMFFIRHGAPTNWQTIRWVLRDNGGRNGTYINQEKLYPDEQVIMNGYETIGLGSPDSTSSIIGENEGYSCVYQIKPPPAFAQTVSGYDHSFKTEQETPPRPRSNAAAESQEGPSSMYLSPAEKKSRMSAVKRLSSGYDSDSGAAGITSGSDTMSDADPTGAGVASVASAAAAASPSFGRVGSTDSVLGAAAALDDVNDDNVPLMDLWTTASFSTSRRTISDPSEDEDEAGPNCFDLSMIFNSL